MAFPDFPLPAAPRGLVNLPVSISTGLGGALFFGWFFMAGCLLLVGISAWQGKYGPMVLLLLFGLAAGYWLKSTYDTLSQRKAAFREGKVVRAEVVRHGRQFSFWKSNRDYTVVLRLEGQGETHPHVTIVHAGVTIWETAPVGAELIGLEHQGAYFFGESIGLHFRE
ncbi:MAG: hypothetical protein D6722_18225 [Bacteroidetes bacterium]|nr:MAG: hypothetical protein D6722_18225 [Bacteroidota bacterium]